MWLAAEPSEVAEWDRSGGALDVATESILIVSAPPASAANHQEVPAVAEHGTVADYWTLTKPEVNFLIAVATLAGFYLGRPAQLDHFPWLRLVHTLLGTLLVASGTGTLNQYIERHFDAQMRRTAHRPLAAGRLTPSAVLWFGITLSSLGSIYLAIAVNTLASVLAIATLVSYLFFYTPLKRKTPLCTLVGALPGAMPPLIGWAAASGRLSVAAWTLCAVLFLWQFPHFMAIAWMYREDYARAGYLVLPRGESRGSFVICLTLLPLVVLTPVLLTPSLLGHAGRAYEAGAFLLGSGFLYFGTQLALRKSNSDARRLLLASIVYLPLVFVLLCTARNTR
jgi:heme o synthase